MRREELDILMTFSAINLALDSVVGDMHLVVEVRQVVLARPVPHLVLVAAGSAVAVGVVAVVLLQEFLVLALQALFEDQLLARVGSRGRRARLGDGLPPAET